MAPAVTHVAHQADPFGPGSITSTSFGHSAHGGVPFRCRTLAAIVVNSANGRMPIDPAVKAPKNAGHDD